MHKDGKKIVKISCGSMHAVAITDAGEVKTWGYSEDGRLGHPEAGDELVPRLVTFLTGKKVKDIVCGSAFSLAVTGRKVYKWSSKRKTRSLCLPWQAP